MNQHRTINRSLFTKILPAVILTLLVHFAGNSSALAASNSDSSLVSLIRAISFARARPLTLAQIRSITNLMAAHRVTSRTLQNDPLLVNTIKSLDAAVLAGDLPTAQVHITTIIARRSELADAELQAAAEFQMGMISVLRSGGQFDLLITRNSQHSMLELIGNLIGYQSIPESMLISNAPALTLGPLNLALSQARTMPLSATQVVTINRSAAAYRSNIPASVDPLLMTADSLLEKSILATDREAARVHIKTLAVRQAQLEDLQMQAGSQFQIAVGSLLKTGNQLDPLIAKHGGSQVLDAIGGVIGYDSDGEVADNAQTGDDGDNGSIDASDSDDRDGSAGDGSSGSTDGRDGDDPDDRDNGGPDDDRDGPDDDDDDDVPDDDDDDDDDDDGPDDDDDR